MEILKRLAKNSQQTKKNSQQTTDRPSQDGSKRPRPNMKAKQIGIDGLRKKTRIMQSDDMTSWGGGECKKKNKINK
ncbi:hypothetical protein M413DRAFT_442205 [Hebeloma cylindrosporum]|uniref:Uncharacterized protein n=1 Tax=Hebeloma cylindrosporum TaxID=76867 RepID=A0A0C2Y6R0_HEBCY|nr:hypothetical protein M413DRAFT_442205 [Hebeloma cylindrosporum h7]